MLSSATLLFAAALAAFGVTTPSFASGPERPAASPAQGQAPARSAKERLSDKASDEQRVNDCHVPPERRTRPRPTDCPAQQPTGR